MKIKEDNVVESDKLVYSFVTYRCMNCGNVMRDEFSCNKNKCRVCGFEDWREVELQEITIVERVAQVTRQEVLKEVLDFIKSINDNLRCNITDLNCRYAIADMKCEVKKWLEKKVKEK